MSVVVPSICVIFQVSKLVYIQLLMRMRRPRVYCYMGLVLGLFWLLADSPPLLCAPSAPVRVQRCCGEALTFMQE